MESSLAAQETKPQNNAPAKKKRRRIKQALKDIQQQVEFYFSDSNLHKDRFLLQKTGKQGINYVPIQLLKDFNCLKELEATSDMIIKAVQRSPLLELDIKKKNIRRKHSLLPASNTDPRTIYIESLPDDTTIKWLKDVTSKLGEVQYISLPRYKKTGAIKGYAFIEFARVEEAQRACTILNSPPTNFFPNRVSKPVNAETEMYATENPVKHIAKKKNIEISNKKQNLEEAPPPKKKLKYDDEKIENNNLSHKINNFCKTTDKDIKNISKNQISISQPNTDIKHSPKKQKNNLQMNHNSSNTNNIEFNKKFEKPNNINSNSDLNPVKNVNSQEKSINSVKDINTLISIGRNASTKVNNLDKSKPQLLSAVVDVTKKKKTRKRTRKQNAAIKVNWKQPPPKLTVMLKTTWNEAKKLYLREQRTALGNLKSIMQKNVHPEHESASVFIKRHAALDAQSDDLETLPENNAEPNISSQENPTNNKIQTHCPPSFQPGVIVKIKNIFPDVQNDFSASKRVNFKCLKSHFSSYGEVAYVDVSTGNNEGFIRFKDSASAQKAILEDQKYDLNLLTGEMEESYWDSLLVSRQLKRSRERKKVRGRDKLVARAEQLMSKTGNKHIKFNSDFP